MDFCSAVAEDLRRAVAREEFTPPDEESSSELFALASYCSDTVTKDLRRACLGED